MHNGNAMENNLYNSVIKINGATFKNSFIQVVYNVISTFTFHISTFTQDKICHYSKLFGYNELFLALSGEYKQSRNKIYEA